MSNKAKTIRVAAIQMESKNRVVETNLGHATPLVNQAAQKGAKVILLPELMPVGSPLSTAMWEVAEPRQGPTVKWLKENSKRLGIWLGASFLEARGEDFFNTFVLTNPDGNEAGRTEKQSPSGTEAFLVRGNSGSHVIETELGKIGVGICYDNYFSYFFKTMQKQSVDMILMPHAAWAIYPKANKEVAHLYSRLLGVPVLMVNKCGTCQSAPPGLPFMQWQGSYSGLSSIADSDGTVKAQLGKEEGVLVEDVTLNPSRKTRELLEWHGRWVIDMPWRLTVIWNLLLVYEAFGRIWYTLSSKRTKRARLISSTAE